MSPQNPQTFEFDGFRLDTAEKSLKCADAQIPLTPKVFDTLQLLVVNAGHLVEKETLMATLWNGRAVEESNLTHNIKVLRKALGDSATSPRFIETVPRRGYRFIADVQSESDRLEPRSSVNRPAEANARSRLYAFIALAVVVLLSISAAAFFWFRGHKPPLVAGSSDRITNSGKVSIAAVSPDGKALVYSQKEDGGESLWKIRFSDGELSQILPAEPVEFIGLSISPSSDLIYYSTFALNAVGSSAFRIPTTGGTPERLPVESDVSVSFSPDGSRFAYTESHTGLRQSTLKIADANGTNARELLIAKGEKRVLPVFRASPVAWSPDGRTIACVVQETDGNDVYAYRVLLVDPDDGSEQYLSEKSWDYIETIAWKNNDEVAAVNIKPNPAGSQLWLVSARTGEARLISGDENEHYWLSAANGHLYAVRKVIYSSLYMTDFDPGLINPRTKQIVIERGVIDSMDWAGEKLYYNSQTTGSNEIWRINPDGTDPVQLSHGSNLTFGFSVSPRDASVVFSASQNQANYLFLADVNGRNVRQLTDGINDAAPRFTSDGSEVVYQQGSMINPTLWRVSSEGHGKPEQLTGYFAMQPSLSPDGNTIAYHFMDTENGERVWKLGLMDRASGRLKKKLDFPKSVSERRTTWRPGDDLLTMVFTEGDRSGFLLLSPAGDGFRLLENITAERISSFVWSPDGSRLAFAGKQETSDVVIIDRAE
jgi:DNA-binding winged helix-turn-helix (wHTH) protein/Tol biopolymer transport system component